MDNAATPIQIHIYRTVPFDRNYSHVVTYPSKVYQNEFFSMLDSVTITGVFIPNKSLLKIPISTFDTHSHFSYMDFSYCTFTFDGRTRYFFIEDVITISPSVIGYQLIEDVWNTYYFTTDVSSKENIHISQALIEREHVDRWNNDTSLPIFHKDVVEDADISIYKEPEFIDLIPEYPTGYIRPKISTAIITYVKASKISTIILPFVEPGTIPTGSMLKPYPESTTTAQILPAEMIATSEFTQVFGFTPEEIVSISITASQPFIWEYYYDSVQMVNFYYPSYTLPLETREYNGATYGYYKFTRSIPESVNSSLPYIKDSHPYQILYKPEYEKPQSDHNLLKDMRYEPIMYSYPYIDRSIIGYDGTRVHTISDNILYTDTDGIMLKLLTQSTISSIAMYFTKDADTSYDAFIKSNNLGLACIVQSPTVDIASDTWATYANTSRQTDRELVVSQSIQQSLEGIVNGASIGAISRTPYGAIAPIVGGLTNVPFNFINQQIKEKSIRNMAQKMLFDGTGETVLQTLNFALKLCLMECNDTIRQIAYDRYTKYGYNVNRIGIPDINSRYYFNYLKTQSCLVEGAMPDRVKREIENVFNNGTTIWHYNNVSCFDIIVSKDCPYENIERSLLL